MAEPLLEVEDLCVDYVGREGDVRAVDEVSFTIHEGDVFGLAGESGSGKSTVIQSILRLLAPPAIITGGRASFRGQDLFDLDDEGLRRVRWRDIALVCQSAMNALNPVLTVGEQICDVIEVHDRVSRTDARRRAGELLELVGIEGSRLDSYPHELSGGMRQRVVIAVALALKPPLLFMDEPTTALDVVVQKEILKTIAELKQELGFSILFITHDLSLMLEFCTQVGILYAGRLVECAPARELFASPRHPYTQGLMRSFPDVRGETCRLEGIPGSPPDLRNPPPGCRFHPRCERVVDDCRNRQPPLVTLGTEHVGACHLET